MRSEEQDLVADTMSQGVADDFRAASLERTLAFVRNQRRTRRRIRAAVAFAGLMALTATAIWWHGGGREVAPKATPPRLAALASTSPTVPGTTIRILSDEQLLGMFPGRPVALMGPPDHRQLVFLDERPD
jgi:hypothetical protein